ncbi:TPA: hypothetical protein TUL06_001241 [Streptococcus equi subsp. zooepidemicus]|nr:hypothetical protein [Streptococcus equi subsp. zooepidemicus]HEL0011579.1 hypothetical protein [Streptococcus equi subsp. zooepidemicus]HEL0014102.1 hypothetical protein [Streptococcus equi subsp. zooepidemicus]HEL0018136.1 hypothetical protein [Streptococcus equi subsp. zooepidemicus]HEL0029613.1 hypothetical protein [Streptococcus equi subsp. zooepidemicus]
MKKMFSKMRHQMMAESKKVRIILKQYLKTILRELSILISKMIGSVILFIILPSLVFIFINFLNAFGIMLKASNNSVLITLISELNLQTLLQLITGTFIIILLTISLYVIGLILELFFKIINAPDKVTKTYIKITALIERWYFLVSIVIWAIISLSDTFFNYFTILVSLVALLREIKTEKQIKRVKIFPRYFLESSESPTKH